MTGLYRNNLPAEMSFIFTTKECSMIRNLLDSIKQKTEEIFAFKNSPIPGRDKIDYLFNSSLNDLSNMIFLLKDFQSRIKNLTPFYQNLIPHNNYISCARIIKDNFRFNFPKNDLYWNYAGLGYISSIVFGDTDQETEFYLIEQNDPYFDIMTESFGRHSTIVEFNPLPGTICLILIRGVLTRAARNQNDHNFGSYVFHLIDSGRIISFPNRDSVGPIYSMPISKMFIPARAIRCKLYNVNNIYSSVREMLPTYAKDRRLLRFQVIHAIPCSCYFVTINLVDNLDENYRSDFPRNLYITDTFNELKLTKSYTKIVNSIEPVNFFDASAINNETPRAVTKNPHMSKNEFGTNNANSEYSINDTEQNIDYVESIQKKKILDTSAPLSVASLSLSSAKLEDHMGLYKNKSYSPSLENTHISRKLSVDNVSEDISPDSKDVKDNNYDSHIDKKCKQSNEQITNTVNDISIRNELAEGTNSNFKDESLNTPYTLDHLGDGTHMIEKLQENSHSSRLAQSGNLKSNSSNLIDAQNSVNDQRVPQEKHNDDSKCNVDIEDDDSIVSECLEEENGEELNLYYTQKWVNEQFQEKSMELEDPIIVDSKSLFNFSNKCNVNAMTIKIHEAINNRKYKIIQHYTLEKIEPQLAQKNSDIYKKATEMVNQLSPLNGVLEDDIDSKQIKGECRTISQNDKNKSESNLSSSFSSVNGSYIARSTSYNSVANLSEIGKIFYEDFVIDPIDDVANEFENLLGTDDKRICPLYDPKTRACFKGASCKLEHVPKHPEGWTTDKVLVFCDTGKLDFPLPVVDTKIKLKITHFESFTNFYAYIVLSPHDFETKIKELDREIHYLENKKVLNAFHRFHLPVKRELVFAYSHIDNKWYRARIEESLGNNFMVKFMDFGYNCEIAPSDLRAWDHRVDYIPFLALRFSLANIKTLDNLNTESFKKELPSIVFIATVIDNTTDGFVHVKLFIDGINMGDDLIKRGHAIYVERCGPCLSMLA